MIEQVHLIADRIKGLRQISGVSPETLAKELGIPRSLLLKYESGMVDIPVGFLYKVAHQFGIEFSVLLSGENPRPHVYCIVRKGRGLSVERRKQYEYEHLAHNFQNKRAEPFIVKIEPGPENTPMEYNSHTGQEFNYVLEGTVKMILDGHEIILYEGDSIYFDSAYKHTMTALDRRSAKILAVVL
jgi:transcriptional regulator with XRE-family HTH domain